MKKTIRLLLSALVVAMSGLFTSCYHEWGGPQPPLNYYDSRLTGYWQLAYINDYPVSRYEVNYLYFDGYGRGEYFFYDYNRPVVDRLEYWCDDYGSPQITIQYESQYYPSTMYYWFGNRGNELYLEWYNGPYPRTYTYIRYYSYPW